MTKADLIEGLSNKLGMNKNEAEKAVNIVLDDIINALKQGERVISLRRPAEGAGPVMTMALQYTLISTRSTFRNVRFLIFTVALPVVMYLLFNNLYGIEVTDNGLNVGAYLMVSMACYGGIGASINAGARIAIERQAGWNRQLRLTALTPRAYLVSKSIVSLLVALPAIVLVFAAGRLVGHAQLTPAQWLESGLALWLTLIPFAVLGLVIGFIGTVDAVQPISMITYMVLAILGGLWFPVDQFPPFLQSLAKLLPSYWSAEVARAPLAGVGIPMQGVVVLLAWTVGLAFVGTMAYRRSGERV